MTLKTYKPEWEEIEIEDDNSAGILFTTQDMIKESIEGKENLNKVYVGERVGWDTRSGCESIIIEEQDKIAYILAESDNFHLKKLTVQLASGAKRVFGSYTFKESENRNEHKFEFDRKVDILGVWGKVSQEAGGAHSEHIHALGFITNECPSRNILDLEHHLLLKKSSTIKDLV